MLEATPHRGDGGAAGRVVTPSPTPGPSASNSPWSSSQALLGALKGSRRFEVIALLAEQAHDVSSLAAALDVHASTASRILHQLRFRQIVEYQQDMNRHVYRISPHLRVEVRENTLHLAMTARDGSRLAMEVTIRP